MTDMTSVILISHTSASGRVIAEAKQQWNKILFEVDFTFQVD